MLNLMDKTKKDFVYKYILKTESHDKLLDVVKHSEDLRKKFMGVRINKANCTKKKIVEKTLALYEKNKIIERIIIEIWKNKVSDFADDIEKIDTKEEIEEYINENKREELLLATVLLGQDDDEISKLGEEKLDAYIKRVEYSEDKKDNKSFGIDKGNDINIKNQNKKSIRGDKMKKIDNSNLNKNSFKECSISGLSTIVNNIEEQYEKMKSKLERNENDKVKLKEKLKEANRTINEKDSLITNLNSKIENLEKNFNKEIQKCQQSVKSVMGEVNKTKVLEEKNNTMLKEILKISREQRSNSFSVEDIEKGFKTIKENISLEVVSQIKDSIGELITEENKKVINMGFSEKEKVNNTVEEKVSEKEKSPEEDEEFNKMLDDIKSVIM